MARRSSHASVNYWRRNREVTLGIIGAGKLGMTLAQLARRAGYEVRIASSSDPSKIALSVDVLAPGARAVTTREAAGADIIILALPLSQFRTLPDDALTDKLVIDATNYWWEIDGPRSDTLPDDQSSSEAIQELLSQSRVVKGLNHMGYHNLHDEARAAHVPGRKAIALAGDLSKDIRRVAQLIDRLGFDPLPIGKLAHGIVLEPGYAAFGANLTRAKLAQLLEIEETPAQRAGVYPNQDAE